MSYKKYLDGGKWFKCDLHVHSPASFVQHYGGDNNTAWNKFLDKLESLPPEVKVIAINDYFLLDGYKKILAEKEHNNRCKNIDLILPCIELRIDIFSGTESNLKDINFHVIFNPELTPETIERDFIKALAIQREDVEGGFNRSLAKENIDELGKRIKEQKPNDVNLQNTSDSLVGFSNITISLDKVLEILGHDHFANNHLKFLGFAEWSNIRWSQAANKKTTICHQVDFLCTANRDPNVVISHRNKLKTEHNIDKLIIQCSDSHKLDDIGESHTWIKGVATFESLRQIIYEPDERVRIQTQCPDTKRDYSVIDKVRFIDNSGENLFPSDYIHLNQNLTTIIGGKSTGKSLLLYYIAKSIDNKQITRLSETMNVKTYDLDSKYPDFNFEIVWSNGLKQLLKGNQEDVYRGNILYIPQNYLNKLSESNYKQKKDINDFVLTTLLEDDELKTLYDVFLEKTKTINAEISTAVSQIINDRQRTEDLTKELKAKGDKKAIEKNLKNIQSKIDKIRESSDLTDEEDKLFSDLEAKKIELDTNITNLNVNKKNFEVFIEGFKNSSAELSNLIIDNRNQFQLIGTETFFQNISTKLDSFQKNIDTEAKKVINKSNEQSKAYNKDLKEINSHLNPILNKIKLIDEIKKLNKERDEETEKIKIINELSEKIKKTSSKIQDTNKKILENYRSLIDSYNGFGNELKKSENKLDDLNLTVTVGFQEEEFNSLFINEFVNKPDLKSLLSCNSSENFEYQYSSATHLEEISNIFKGIYEGTVKLKTRKNLQEALLNLFQSRFYIDFDIVFKGDSLIQMSPGKKGLVLLKLLIDLSNSTDPILLDQPEDDLDNRSVYNQLVTFIRQKKKQRQIIIVTHNPNLVVGADTESVIVANQSGQEIYRDNEKFKFEYVSGPLEHSFMNQEQKSTLLSKGIREHVCEILEGGQEAFKKRELRYNI